MAKKAGFGVVEYGDTPVVLGELRSWDTNQEAADRDTTVMGSGTARIEPGSITHTVEVELYFEDPDDAGQALLRTQLGNETPQDLGVYPFGKTTGKAALTGKAYVMRNNSSGPEGADGSVQMSVRFTSDAAGLSWGTVA